MKREMICIVCPAGCRLTVNYSNDNEPIITGNGCNRGITYATNEITDPRRTVTTTIAVKNRGIRCPVKSDKPVPKKDIDVLLSMLHKINMDPPVKSGDIIISNFDNTGINILSTSSIE